jgi:GNAT superfamily N-acetyltransferase
LAGSNKAYEQNEVAWWSNWAQVTWLDQNAYTIFSKDFEEYFFNRGGFLQVTPESRKTIEPMEREFEARGRTPHIFLQSAQLDAKLLTAMADRGYRIADQMSVMEIDEPAFKVNSELRIELVEPGQLEEWARIYLDSFYGELTLLKTVTSIVGKLARVKEASLLIGTIGGEPAGVLALFRSAKVCGVYCVGTHRMWRRKHVASTMLDHSHRLALGEGRRLVLQTILSDSAEAFYTKLGFKRAYLKELFVRGKGRAGR